MPVAAVILVEPTGAANLGAVLRAAANFAVPRVDVVRPGVDPADPEVAAWACGAGDLVELHVHDRFAAAAAPYALVAATVSGRGRSALPAIAPADLAALVDARGAATTALVFGTEASGLPRQVLDRTDVAVRVPTSSAFPVLNLAQAVGILLAGLAAAAPDPAAPAALASHVEVERLMDHLRIALLEIGFLDPGSPDRILRQLRRLFGRAGMTVREVAILRGICRQMTWARHAPPARWRDADGSPDDRG